MERPIEAQVADRPRRAQRLLASVGAMVALGLPVSGCVMNGAWATLPDPVDAGDGLILDVACTAADDCLAGGYAIDGSGAIVRRWDGATWGEAGAPNGSELHELDCGAAGRCAALVRDRSILRTASFAVWDGDGWTDVPPGPAVVDAPAPFACATDGDWYVVPAAPGGPTASYLAVSCVPAWCLASGFVPPVELGPYEFVASAYTWTNP